MTVARAPSAGDLRLVEAGLPESIDQLAAGMDPADPHALHAGEANAVRQQRGAEAGGHAGQNRERRSGTGWPGRRHARDDTRGGQWKEGTPLVAAECSFRRASQTEEKFLVERHVSRFGRSSFTISHVFRDASGEITAEGKETRIWAREDGDARSLESVPIPDDVRRRLAG